MTLVATQPYYTNLFNILPNYYSHSLGDHSSPYAMTVLTPPQNRVMQRNSVKRCVHATSGPIIDKVSKRPRLSLPEEPDYLNNPPLEVDSPTQQSDEVCLSLVRGTVPFPCERVKRPIDAMEEDTFFSSYVANKRPVSLNDRHVCEALDSVLLPPLTRP